MSVTIDSLDIQIRSSAGSAAQNIDELAEKLGKLKKNGSLGVVTKNLGNLAGALNTLKGSLSGLENLDKISKAMEGLSGIQKLSGLNSAVNTLKKIPSVLQGLDTALLDEFKVKMQQLATGLGPLATQLDNIGNSFNKLPAKVRQLVTATNRMNTATRAATSSQKAHGEAIDVTSLNMATAITNIEGYIAGVRQVVQTISSFMADAIEWDGIQFRFGRAFGEDAEEVYEYVQKVSDALKINTQQFMQYSSMYGSLLSGFGMEQEQVTTISIGLTELSYDIWAAYNDRYKTLEDASEAVRSAITGEIEPIRNAGIALTEASMQEYIDSLGMAHLSVQNMTEAQKSEVRYATMVNAAMKQGIVGTYAKEMNTAEGAVRTLTQQMKGLAQAIGSLFIPVLQTVVPWITAFISLLYDLAAAIASIFGISFFEIDWGNSAKGISDVATGAQEANKALTGAGGAAKKLRDYTMGFDELNVIDPTSASGGGGGGVGGLGEGGLGLDLDTLWDDSVFAHASEQVDEIKQKIKDFANEHKILLSVIGGTGAFLGFMKILRGLNSLLGVTKTIDNLKTAFTGLKKALGGLKTVGGNVKAFFTLLKEGNGLGATLAAAFPKAADILSSAKTWVTGTLGPAVKKALKNLPKILSNGIKAIPGWGWVIGAIASVLALVIVDYDFTDIGYKLGNALGTAFKKIGEWLTTAGDWIASVGRAILDGLNSAWEWVKEEFDINSVFEAIFLMMNPVALVTKIVPKLIEIGAEILPGIWQGIEDGWNNFWGNIMEFIDGFVQGFKDALGIHSPSTVFAGIGDDLVQGLLNGIKDRWNSVKDWFNTTVKPKFTLSYWKKMFDTVRQAIRTKLDEVKQSANEKWNAIVAWYDANVAPKLTMDYWLGKFAGLKDGFVQTIKNMVNAGIDMMNRFIGYLNDHLSFSWEGLEIMGKQIYPSGSVQLFTIPTIPRLENGGVLEDGLFTMNRGEIAGKFTNGKSVVANNQMIVEGIAAGVYEAVVAAMNETNRQDNQNVNVYLDGKQIYASVKKTEARRGMTLMGSQLGYSY